MKKELDTLTIKDFKKDLNPFEQCVIIALWCYLHKSDGTARTSFT